MFLRIFIVGSLFSVAVRFDERRLAIWAGIAVATLITVTELVFGAGASWITALGFLGDLGVCLVSMTILTADLSGFVWGLVLAASSFLLVFKVPIAIARELIGG